MSLFETEKKLPGESAASLYRASENHPRFAQKNHMALQTEWNSEFAELAPKMLTNRKQFVAENKPGFSILDRAFNAGSAAILSQSGFSMHNSNLDGTSWDVLTLGPAGSARWEADHDTASKVIDYTSRYFGADLVGFTELDRRWVYSHYFDAQEQAEYPIVFSDEPGYESYQDPGFADNKAAVIPEKMKHVIVLIHEMEYDAIKAGPNLVEVGATRLAYSQIAFTAISLAEFIRALGYNAIPSANDVALNIPLAVDAGLGEMGRNGKLINPHFGPRCRISKVITDLPLPSAVPVDLGVRNFCRSCNNCYQACPVKAISDGDQVMAEPQVYTNGGIWRWETDEIKCRKFWTKSGTNCGLCVTSCPFNKPAHKKVYRGAKWSVSRLPAFNKLLLSANNALKLNEPTGSSKFWQIKTGLGKDL